ncbi:unnamed protein product [Nesidiocoris tenuis]|uniref:Uncharacterized protein n=1 Tax=Nesidiocoris tenuis TaxID=355587 RepID=A0A6H5G5D1_9HEMI|nr:unnamed protein product [Nesidiocoris tenuis]
MNHNLRLANKQRFPTEPFRDQVFVRQGWFTIRYHYSKFGGYTDEPVPAFRLEQMHPKSIDKNGPKGSALSIPTYSYFPKHKHTLRQKGIKKQMCQLLCHVSGRYFFCAFVTKSLLPLPDTESTS